MANLPHEIKLCKAYMLTLNINVANALLNETVASASAEYK